jgi:hypothetical protein
MIAVMLKRSIKQCIVGGAVNTTRSNLWRDQNWPCCVVWKENTLHVLGYCGRTETVTRACATSQPRFFICSRSHHLVLKVGTKVNTRDSDGTSAVHYIVKVSVKTKG